jgi:hypothetical protein
MAELSRVSFSNLKAMASLSKNRVCGILGPVMTKTGNIITGRVECPKSGRLRDCVVVIEVHEPDAEVPDGSQRSI